MPSSNSSKIVAVIRRIPRGKVATYGQIAKQAGLPGRARLVGRVLKEQPATSKLPWHRVVNARGEISYASSRESADHLQRLLLEAEGIEFHGPGRIDLARYRWNPAK